MSRNLILGTAFYRELEPIRVFVESLRRHYQGEVILLVSGSSGPQVHEYLHRHRVRRVIFNCAHWMAFDLQFARYIRYSEILSEATQPYDRIMLSDVGDVLFQADPFAGLPAGNLLFFLEDERTRIGGSQANSEWVREIYGAEVLELLKTAPISCSGTTIGTHPAIAKYLARMLWEGRPEVMARLRRDRRGYDQGMHNHMIQTGVMADATLIRNDAFVWTLHNVPDAEIVADGQGIHTLDGRYPPVIHQYPMKALTKAWVQSAYPPPA